MTRRKNFLLFLLIIMIGLISFTMTSFADSSIKKTCIDLTKVSKNCNPTYEIDRLNKEGWKWEPITKTLTLKNLYMTVDNPNYKFAIYLPANSKIKLIGKNEIITNNIAGISTKDNSKGKLTIFGNGELKITTKGCPSEAIVLNSSQLNINDCTLNLTSSDENEAIFDKGEHLDIYMNNSVVNCSSNVSEAINIYGLLTLNDSKLNVTSKRSTPVYCESGIKSYSSNITIKSFTYNGIEAMNDISFKNSSAKIISKKYGIYLGNKSKLTLENSTISSKDNDGNTLPKNNTNSINITMIN